MNEHYFSEKPSSKIKLQTIKTNLRNQVFQFLTSSGVFSPNYIDKGTRLLIETMEIPKIGNFLDLGTGYGVVGIVMASVSPNCTVLMIDKNERAIWLAKENIRLNAINNAQVRIGGLESVRNLKFNMIISNPPLSIGYKKLLSLISSIPSYLDEKGNFQIVIRKTHKKIISLMKNIFTNIQTLKKKSGYIILKCWINK